MGGISEIGLNPIESVLQATHAGSPVRCVHGVEHFVEFRREIGTSSLLEYSNVIGRQENVLGDIKFNGRQGMHVVGQVVDVGFVNGPDSTQKIGSVPRKTKLDSPLNVRVICLTIDITGPPDQRALVVLTNGGQIPLHVLVLVIKSCRLGRRVFTRCM